MNINENKWNTIPHNIKDLILFADNDPHLNDQSKRPILVNLAKKLAKKEYKKDLARDLWGYHADNATKSYHNAFGDRNQPWHKAFSPADRKIAAAHWEEKHFEELKNALEDKNKYRLGEGIDEEALNELSTDLLARYVDKASKQGLTAIAVNDHASKEYDKTRNPFKKFIHKINMMNTKDVVLKRLNGLKMAKRAIHRNMIEDDPYVKGLRAAQKTPLRFESYEDSDTRFQNLFESILDKKPLEISESFNSLMKETCFQLVQERKEELKKVIFSERNLSSPVGSGGNLPSVKIDADKTDKVGIPVRKKSNDSMKTGVKSNAIHATIHADDTTGS